MDRQRLNGNQFEDAVWVEESSAGTHLLFRAWEPADLVLRYHGSAGGYARNVDGTGRPCGWYRRRRRREKESKAMLLIGWFSIGMAVAALSIFLGAELRSRYKFKRRTPYDFYSNAGKQQASEFGVGI